MTNSLQPSTTILEQRILQAVLWIRTHQERFWTVLGTVALTAMVIAFAIQHRHTENEEAWVQLGSAQGYLQQNKFDEAGKALDQWMTRFASSDAAGYAKFLRGDLLFRSKDYAGASKIYADLAQTASPAELRPLAAYAQISAEEMAGNLPQAQALAQQFLDRYSEHFFASNVYFVQARLAELSGSANAAAGIYERFAILYPQSPWTAMARARASTLTVNNAAPKS